MKIPTYSGELTEAMTLLAEQPNTIFLGQSISYPGNNLFKTMVNVPAEKKIELPVMEDAQLGMCIGLALSGRLPVCIFPRMDFLMCAMNQLVNHLDKFEGVKVIIRTCVGATSPMHPGSQHCGDYTEGLAKMLKNIRVMPLSTVDDILPAYAGAIQTKKSIILVEYGNKYGMS